MIDQVIRLVLKLFKNTKLKPFDEVWSTFTPDEPEHDNPDWIDAVEWAKELIKKCDEESAE